MGLPAATTATAAPASRGMSSLATALLRCAVTPPRGVAPRATPNVTRDFHASASTRALRGGSRDDHPLVISGQSASGRGSAKSVVWVPSGAGVRDSGNAAASGAAAAWHQQQHRERQQQYPQRHQQLQQSARPPQRPQVRQQHQAAPQAHHHEATHAEVTQPPPQHHQVFAQQQQQQHQQQQHQQPLQQQPLQHPPPPPPRQALHQNNTVAPGHNTRSATGRKVYCDFAIYKSKTALKLSVIRATYETNAATGASHKRRDGCALLEFAPATGARQYDWSRKQTISLSPVELAELADALDRGRAVSFFHDPNMGTQRQGALTKSLKGEPMPDGSGGAFLNMAVSGSAAGAGAKHNVAVSRAEFAALKMLAEFLVPRLMGFGEVFEREKGNGGWGGGTTRRGGLPKRFDWFLEDGVF